MGNSYDNIVISKKERRHVEKRIDRDWELPRKLIKTSKTKESEN